MMGGSKHEREREASIPVSARPLCASNLGVSCTMVFSYFSPKARSDSMSTLDLYSTLA
jgi:hypothetical protein